MVIGRTRVKKLTTSQPEKPPTLRRSLTLPLVVLYGLGVTIGAGIYVLIGATAAQAGHYAPMAFLVAAVVMLPSACSFAEFVGRLPVSAGEAAYVRHGFNSKSLGLAVGLLVVSSGIVSASAISVGSVGYIQHFIDAPQLLLIPMVILLLGAIAAWGILESVMLPAILTVIEISGLLIIVGAGFFSEPTLVSKLPQVIPPLFDTAIWSGILGASLLAFFAFVGFEDLVNVAEETQTPSKTMPLAIFITLAVTALLYALVSSVAVLIVPLNDLSHAKAPLSLVYQTATGSNPELITAIAILATLNGMVIQMIMASRVIYGLSNQGVLPKVLSSVHPITRTPLLATALVVATILTLAMSFPMEGLAEMTSRIALTVFLLVNIALLRVKWRGDPAPEGTFIVWTWVPVVGAICCLFLLFAELF